MVVSHFRHERSAVWIQSWAKFYADHVYVFTVNCWNDKNEEKEAGKGPFWKSKIVNFKMTNLTVFYEVLATIGSNLFPPYNLFIVSLSLLVCRLTWEFRSSVMSFSLIETFLCMRKERSLCLFVAYIRFQCNKLQPERLSNLFNPLECCFLKAKRGRRRQHRQCDQICRFLKLLGNKFCFKSRPSILGDIFVYLFSNIKYK